MIHKILTTLFFILFITPAIAQLSKKDQKKLKKLKKQYEFVSLDNGYFSTPKGCDKIIVGSFSRGPSDGGGGFNKGITNLKVVTLDGDVLKPINDYGITLPFGNDDNKYRYIMRTISHNGKVGLMNNCGNVILPPTYDHINLFNEEGLAVAFSGNSIDVINSDGISILTEKMPYKVNYNDFWTVPSPGEITQLRVINGKLFISDGDGKYAIFDVENKTNVTDFKYTYLSTKTITLNNKVYVKASIAPYKTLVDINTGKELLPNNKFYDIVGTRMLEDTRYIQVVANKEPYNRNLYNLSTQELLLPTNISLYDATEYVENRPNLIIIQAIKGYGVFDLETNRFLIEPKEDFTRIYGRGKVMEFNTLLIDLKDASTYEFFDLDTNKLLDLYISRKKLNLSLSRVWEFDSGKKFFRVRITPSSSTATQYFALYDENWREIHVGNPKTTIYINKKAGIIEIKEMNDLDEVIKFTKVDENGEIVI